MVHAPIDDMLLDRLVVLIGGSGFFGRHLAQELLGRGARLRIASRHPETAYAIRTLGDLGQVAFVGCDVTRPETLVRAVAGADAVVNLVGAFAGDLDAVQGRGAGAAAAAARAAGASAFVHISAINADPASSIAYARTKAEGEKAVQAAFPAATILRPSVMFGEDDAFVNMFGRIIALAPFVPVFGPSARLQPVFVDDVARAVAAALADPHACGGKIYEIAGPEAITMLELFRRIARAEARRTPLLPLSDGLSGAIASLTGWLPGAPITADQWQLLKMGSIASGRLPGLADLGIEARPLGLYLDRWMIRFRKHGRFAVNSSAA